MKILDETIVLELLDVDKISNILEFAKKYNPDLFDFVKRKNFNLKFNKK